MKRNYKLMRPDADDVVKERQTLLCYLFDLQDLLVVLSVIRYTDLDSITNDSVSDFIYASADRRKAR